MKLASHKDLKLKRRGNYDVAVTTDSTEMAKWYDNKSVLVASSFVTEGQLDTGQRWLNRDINYFSNNTLSPFLV